MSLKRPHGNLTTDNSCADRTTTHVLDNQINHVTSLELEESPADETSSCRERRKATALDENDSNIGYCQATRLRRKAKLVKSACAQCQRRKTKCSGRRPVCQSYNDRALECFWDVDDGLTRTADLKDKLRKATQSYQDLGTLLDTLRHSTDQTSCMLLAKLRLGVSLKDLIAEIRLETCATDESNLDASVEGTYSQPPMPLLHL